MARKRNHPATVRDVYSRRLGAIRRGRGWTQQQLADEMARVGFPINRATIAKIEAGKRPMEVSELVAFATAFDVSPASLFLPLGEGKEIQLVIADTVALTDGVTVDAETAALWVGGDAPLDPANLRTYALESPRVVTELTARMRTSGTVTSGKPPDG